MEIKRFSLGDIVKMRKPHPCGSYEWEVTRLGADIKIRCCKCNRQVMLPRTKFEKNLLKVLKNNEGE